MKLSSDALTILSGLLADLAIMQRKVEAGQGATCCVDVFEDEDIFLVSFEAKIDRTVVVTRAKYPEPPDGSIVPDKTPLWEMMQKQQADGEAA